MKLKPEKFNGTKDNSISQREIDNGLLSRKAATEGIVLLENRDNVLPLDKSKPVALYGRGAVKTIKGGTGSGDVNSRKTVSILEGMENAGFTITSKDWLDGYVRLYDEARLAWKDEIHRKANEGRKEGDNMSYFVAYSSTPFFIPAGQVPDVEKAKADGADTAIFVLSRIAGENKDRTDTEGDYYISKEEKAVLTAVCRRYDNVVLIINAGGPVELTFADEFENIKGIIYIVQAGREGGNALADIISGRVTPSGKLTDTWADSYADLPNARTFSFKSGDIFREDYIEGIYVGYRYFDTFDVDVRYGFGYGLSYTTFEIDTLNTTVTDDKATVKVQVKNTGDKYSGKEVVQIYASAPQTRMGKEYRRLVAFAKTDLLAPGASQTLEITFPLYSLASFDEEKSAWVLDKGEYAIWVGRSLHTSRAKAVLVLDGDVALYETMHILPLQHELKELKPDTASLADKLSARLKGAKEAGCPVLVIDPSAFKTEVIEYNKPLPEDKEAWDTVEKMTTDQLVAMTTGRMTTGFANGLGSAGIKAPGSAAQTPDAALDLNVASIVLADGPAGLRLNQYYQVKDGQIIPQSFLMSLEGGYLAEKEEIIGDVYYQYTTAIPVGTLLAQSWDTALLEEVGEMIGDELELFNTTLWLAPGMNIHRNPLCGRNFEYYSEDPLLSGMMAAAITKGVQKKPGVGTTIKHFACNNQEDNRMGSDSVISERALREIYLKGFEVAVKTSQPMSIMTSYNMINGVHAANSVDLCNRIARDEWGFEGVIMTDWTTTTGSTRGISTASGCIKAGNDMVMPGAQSDHEDVRAALADGSLTMDELKKAIYNTVRITFASLRYEDAKPYGDRFTDLEEFVEVK